MRLLARSTATLARFVFIIFNYKHVCEPHSLSRLTFDALLWERSEEKVNEFVATKVRFINNYCHAHSSLKASPIGFNF